MVNSANKFRTFANLFVRETDLHQPLPRYSASMLPGLLLALLLLAVQPLPALGADPVVIWGGPATVNQVAITFDDGPSPRYTPEILALLQHYQAHATFFVLGRRGRTISPSGAGPAPGRQRSGQSHLRPSPADQDDDGSLRESEVERTAVDLDLLGRPDLPLDLARLSAPMTPGSRITWPTPMAVW